MGITENCVIFVLKGCWACSGAPFFISIDLRQATKYQRKAENYRNQFTGRRCSGMVDVQKLLGATNLTLRTKDERKAANIGILPGQSKNNGNGYGCLAQGLHCGDI